MATAEAKGSLEGAPEAWASWAPKYSPLSHSGVSMVSTAVRWGATSAIRARTPSRSSYGSGAPTTSERARTIFQSSRALPHTGTARFVCCTRPSVFTNVAGFSVNAAPGRIRSARMAPLSPWVPW